jgi:hypothetical protein
VEERYKTRSCILELRRIAGRPMRPSEKCGFITLDLSIQDSAFVALAKSGAHS